MNSADGLPEGSGTPPCPQIVRFGLFEFDTEQGRLTRRGHKVKLQQQPATVLACLVRRPGAIITREELQKTVWPTGTWVDFDYGLNTAINRIRRALGDSGVQPRFIENIPKQGYRFIAPVERVSPAVVIEPPTSGDSSDPSGSLNEPEPPGPAIMPSGPITLPSPSSGAAGEPPASRRMFPRTVIVIAIAGIAAALLLLFVRPKAPVTDLRVLRSTIVLPPEQRVEAIAISPQGDRIVYQAAVRGASTLYQRSLDSDESHPVPGAETAYQPFFSPDGREFGFYTGSSLRVATGSSFRDVARIPPYFDLRYAFWGDDGQIYFNSSRDGKLGIWHVSPAGGEAQAVALDDRTNFGQQLLRGGEVLLYSTNFGPPKRSIRWLDRKTGTSQTLIERGMGGTVLPSGHLLFYWRGSLLAAPLNLQSMRLTGSPMEVVRRVGERGWTGPNAAVSTNGTLVYVKQPELRARTLDWVSAGGRREPLPLPPAAWEQATVSPDGAQLLLVRRDDLYGRSVWVYARHTAAWTRLIESADKPRAVWSPDSKSVVVGYERDQADFPNLYRIPIGAPQNVERLTEQADAGQFPQSWSAAANGILFVEGVHPHTKSDIAVLPLTGERRPRTLVATDGWDTCPSFSPDGKRFVYASEREGGMEVFIQGYPVAGTPVQISHGGGREPLWAPDGKRIYYLDSHRNLMEVSLTPDGLPATTKQFAPAPFTVSEDIWTRGYSIAPDGHLLAIRAGPEPASPASQIVVVVNWFEELKRLSPVP